MPSLLIESTNSTLLTRKLTAFHCTHAHRTSSARSRLVGQPCVGGAADLLTPVLVLTNQIYYRCEFQILNQKKR